MRSDPKFVFYARVDDLKQDDAFRGLVPPDVSNVDQLMEGVAAALKFPAYFGENWDALLDCRRDLSWIEQRKVCLIHPNIPDLSTGDLRIYFDVLRDAVNDWKDGEAHDLIAAFPSSTESKVRKILRAGTGR